MIFFDFFRPVFLHTNTLLPVSTAASLASQLRDFLEEGRHFVGVSQGVGGVCLSGLLGYQYAQSLVGHLLRVHVPVQCAEGVLHVTPAWAKGEGGGGGVEGNSGLKKRGASIAGHVARGKSTLHACCTSGIQPKATVLRHCSTTDEAVT